MRKGCGPVDEGFEEGGGGSFGIRRPLRFLAHKLDLDESQIATLARILDELKTERAQAEVDRRRTVAAFADALTGSTFDQARANEGGDLRLKSAERLREAVLKALQQIHAVLNPEQRARLAYLIRTGTLAL
ncbi:MAG: Spy/CpxP family protein refolding chaperone [Gemmataceae bacterium]|nr:Spy/CpxP family protein refolding chaperone [Gemmataceae bacterium]